MFYDEENECYTYKPKEKRKRTERRVKPEPIAVAPLTIPQALLLTKDRRRAPHIDGWLCCREVRDFIAASNKYAPKQYHAHNILTAIKLGRRNIRWMKCGRYVYLHEEDLRYSLKLQPIYEGHGQSPQYKSICREIFHPYLPCKPFDNHIYATIKQAAEVLGEKECRIYGLVKKLTIKGFMINGKLHVRLDEARDAVALRPSWYIKRIGLDPKNYKTVKTYCFNNATIALKYAPDLIGK